MNTTLIHISDLHFQENWEEDQELVLNAFFEDLSYQIEKLEYSKPYLVFSGDFVKAGGENKLYSKFEKYFEPKLSKLGLSPEYRFCVPGNHDVSQPYVLENIIEHEGVIGQKLNEHEFNSYTQKTSNIFSEKFTNYLEFEKRFTENHIDQENLFGKGWEINNNIGIFCLNTALCSSGGAKKNGKNLSDLNRLSVNTRTLQKWNQTNKYRFKVLLGHHPLEWLSDWSKSELENILHNNFSLFLSGHNHNHKTFHTIHPEPPLVECSSPALLTTKHGELGYSLITIDNNIGVKEITYRQWVNKAHKFVSGVNFSGNDEGKIYISPPNNKASTSQSTTKLDELLTNRVEQALRSFPTQPTIWIDPILNETSEVDASNHPEHKFNSNIRILDIIENPESMFIKAPPQFGLSCLAYKLCELAWTHRKSIWIYLNASEIKHYSFEKSLSKEFEVLGVSEDSVECIILDSWMSQENNQQLLLENLCNKYPNIPIIVMYGTNDITFLLDSKGNNYNRAFKTRFLWTLTRNQIREIVNQYNNFHYIGDGDQVVSKLVSDLEVLNLPRTPLNCITLLKASEVDFEDSPVNRSELINRILFILFNTDGIPTYKERPDLKDSEYVLGYFCEYLVKENNFLFTREQFIIQINKFCKEKILDLEVQVVFDILYNNFIIVNRGDYYSFRFTYWIFYFIAQRMHQDKDFAEYMFSNLTYIRYPEIIEFYTGIDRRRDDALTILIKDLEIAKKIIEEKCGFPKDLDPYQYAEWVPSKEGIKKMQQELVEGVSESNLPAAVKDSYADELYDHSRPYHQEIKSIINEYSLSTLMFAVSAASRGLRNSDYANPELKRNLIRTITESWEQISKVLFILAPLLAKDGFASYDGAHFQVIGKLDNDFMNNFNSIMAVLPRNIVDWFMDDIYSRKMGPLLIDQLHNNNSNFIDHSLYLLMASKKPKNWDVELGSYIKTLPKNSFYLYDINRTLHLDYQYGFNSYNTNDKLKNLLKMIYAKHVYGIEKPGKKSIKKISDNDIS